MSLSRSNPSAGLNISNPNIASGAKSPLKIEYSDILDEETFKIEYILDGVNKTFYFAMLPAVEHQLQYGAGGNLRGQGGVPEVKPGLLYNTDMNYPIQLVPGGSPVIQTTGIRKTTRQLVGTFIGSENIGSKPTLNPIYRIDMDTEPFKDGFNAATAAGFFEKEVVYSGRPVVATVKADVLYTLEGCIMRFKRYVARAERVYYCMDLLATEYPGRMSSHSG